MKIELTKSQISYLKSLDSKKKKRKFLLDCFVENIEVEIEAKELIEKSNEVAKLPTDFCVKITDENRDVLQEIWSKRGQAVVGNYLITNSLNTYLMQNNEPFLEIENFGKKELPIVETDEFLKYIGREDLIDKKSEQGSELLKFDMLEKSKKSFFLNKEQIEDSKCKEQKSYKYTFYSQVELTQDKIDEIIEFITENNENAN
jgi:hypothetical protein